MYRITEDEMYLQNEAEWRTEQVERWLDTATPDEVANLWNEYTGFHDTETYLELADLMVAIAFGKYHKHAKNIQKLCYEKMVPSLVKNFDVFVRMI